MTAHRVVTDAAWEKARRKLLEKEKAFSRAREELAQERRRLPWRRVTGDYAFRGPRGKAALVDLFQGCGQLVVYHFMFEPSWKEGCPMCSFWADQFERNTVHLRARDVSLVAVSRAPQARLKAYARRMGWTFPWFTAVGTDFNRDFHVTITAEDVAAGKAMYNHAPTDAVGDLPGVSVFTRDDDGNIFHAYSCYARGLDMLNTAYQYLDLVPRGRDEGALEWPMAWVHRRDAYPVTPRRGR